MRGEPFFNFLWLFLNKASTFGSRDMLSSPKGRDCFLPQNRTWREQGATHGTRADFSKLLAVSNRGIAITCFVVNFASFAIIIAQTVWFRSVSPTAFPLHVVGSPYATWWTFTPPIVWSGSNSPTIHRYGDCDRCFVEIQLIISLLEPSANITHSHSLVMMVFDEWFDNRSDLFRQIQPSLDNLQPPPNQGIFTLNRPSQWTRQNLFFYKWRI